MKKFKLAPTIYSQRTCIGSCTVVDVETGEEFVGVTCIDVARSIVYLESQPLTVIGESIVGYELHYASIHPIGGDWPEMFHCYGRRRLELPEFQAAPKLETPEQKLAKAEAELARLKLKLELVSLSKRHSDKLQASRQAQLMSQLSTLNKLSESLQA